MTYWTQIVSYPSLLFGPAILAAIVSGLISLWVGRSSRRATSNDVDRKIAAERELTDAKLGHERERAISDRAWTDYTLRRDIYLGLTEKIDYLFASRQVTLAEEANNRDASRREFMEMSRKTRLIGSDAVVTALNELTSAIRKGEDEAIMGAKYSALMNAIRKDIRTLNENPPRGTALGSDAFPIEN
ncbi:MAG: hypothetical protein LKJ19_07850 [Acetobacter fabarum]|jgi:hypothetical protein|nr:hypothetical protein [Acetobacter fabarum]MCI2024527.1 hypothetical protein [Acetobacter fabarum]